MMGDHNITILNYDFHAPSGEFVDTISSYTPVPFITRPTRVTAKSATLIDTVFTNNFENRENYFQSVLVTDISDQRPIFYIYCVNKVTEIERCAERRICNETSKQGFSLGLKI